MSIADKQLILAAIRDEFERWEELLSGLSEAQIIKPDLPADLSIKDVIAHLMAWQQRTLARLEAARLGSEPQFPAWPKELDPDTEEDLEAVNAWILAAYLDQPWSAVYRLWRDGYRRFVDLTAALPVDVLLEPGRFAWLGEYSLSDIVRSSYVHHHEEHYEPLAAWLRAKGLIA